MKTFTFAFESYQGGRIYGGLKLVADERFGGQVVLVGDTATRQSRYERLALDRFSPAVVEDNRVVDAVVKKITPQTRQDGRPSRPFYVLAADPRPSDEAVLVRVNTEGVYTRNMTGYFTAAKGKPETVVSGEGRHGLAGNLGGWQDALVVMREGDALRVIIEGGSKTSNFALFVEAGQLRAMLWQEWEAYDAARTARQAPPEIVFGRMPAFTFQRGASATLGIEVKADTSAGLSVVLGEDKRGSVYTLVPVLGVVDSFTTAAVVKAGGKIALSQNAEPDEPGAVLVRVHPDQPSHVSLYTSLYRGEAVKVADGRISSGIAGYSGSAPDELWVLKPGAIVVVGTYDHKWRVLENIQGTLQVSQWADWELAEARRDPTPFIADGWAPADMVPAEWVGSVVVCCDKSRMHLNGGPCGLLSVKPVLLDYGWDQLTKDRNYTLPLSEGAVWVQRRPELQMAAPTTVQATDEEIRFGSPPLPVGRRLQATIVTESGDYRVTVANVPALKYRVTRYDKSGQDHSQEEFLAEVEGQTYTATFHAMRDGFLYCDKGGGYLTLPDGLKELNGEYAVELQMARGSGWYLHVLGQQQLDAERERMLAEVAERAPLKRLVRPIPGQPGIYGMPVGEDGWPCEATQASKWVLYMEVHRWPNTDPDAFVLEPMKGYRSKSTGATFRDLVRDFTRP